MDPNQALQDLRNTFLRYFDEDEDPGDVLDAVHDQFEALDDWLMSGGFPPEAWHNMPKGIVLTHSSLTEWAGRELSEEDLLALADKLPDVLRGMLAESDEYRCAPGEGAPGSLPTWTVLGVWQDGEAVAVGVLEGEHQAVGGDDGFWDEGVWATHVEAVDAAAAEDEACHDMMAGDDEQGGDEDAAVEVTIRGHRFREDHEGAPLRCLDHPEFVVDLESGVEPAMQVGEHVGAPARMPTLVAELAQFADPVVLADLSAMGGDEDWAGMDAEDRD